MCLLLYTLECYFVDDDDDFFKHASERDRAERCALLYVCTGRWLIDQLDDVVFQVYGDFHKLRFLQQQQATADREMERYRECGRNTFNNSYLIVVKLEKHNYMAEGCFVRCGVNKSFLNLFWNSSHVIW